MDNVIIEVLKENEIGEYSELINEVMEEFNSEEIDGFQRWFASVEGIIFRRESGFDDGSFDTIQFAAKYEGKIIGALEVENQDHIQSFFIKKEFQNKGIGKMLLNYSIDFFNEKQLSLIRYKVLSSDYAINIYKSLGFRGEGKRLYLEIERPEEEGRHYFVFPKSQKWAIKLDGKLPWQEEAENYDDEENIKSA
jgi:ribosomal protein S18 acetylase RimI-like enzyme